jgi:hypothetical protein
MGTSCASYHVFVGSDDAGQQQAVASAVTFAALISPPRNGWVSVFPESEYADESTLPDGHLSTATGRPVLVFNCYDSDVAMALLSVDGEIVGDIRIEWPGMMDDMMAMMGDMDDDEMERLGIEPDAVDREPFPGVNLESLAVSGNPTPWIAALGRGDADEIAAAVNADPDSPLADQVATALFSCFGLDGDRLTMTYRWYERGEQPDEASLFVRVG